MKLIDEAMEKGVHGYDRLCMYAKNGEKKTKKGDVQHETMLMQTCKEK